MNTATAPILVALVLLALLGLVVFQSNPKRRSNQAFLLLAMAGTAWLVTLYFATTATTASSATFFIRQASVCGPLILLAFNFLRLAIRYPELGWGAIVRRSRAWLIATAVVAVLCQTKLFLVGAILPTSSGATPHPVYGHAAELAYFGYFTAAALMLVASAWRDWRATSGGQRAEMAFVLIGASFTLIFPLLTLLLNRVLDPSLVLRFAPLRVLLFSIVVAYAISTRKIMEVGTLFQRAMSYLLLATYLLTLYTLVWWLVATVLHSFTDNAHGIAHVAAAIVIAFAMAPARGVSQRFAERLFIRSQQLDFRLTVSKAADILSSVTTLRDLLQRFAEIISEAVATDRVIILLHTREGYSSTYSLQNGQNQSMWLPGDGPIVSFLKTHREPVVLDELNRIRPTPDIVRLASRMRELDVAVAMGIFSREHLLGIMLLGLRQTGRIYSTRAQEALQILCGQLAVAIENAELFTEVQNAKIYNETLLENLTTGVVAAGTDERITVFNNEAGQITGLEAEEVVDRPIDALPQPLCEILRQTLRTNQREEHRDVTLRSGERAVVVRASTSIFHGESQEVLGALMVLTDMTAVKRLELQIRRSDRLASLGTLSAGMAHEIKNPLVSIKTFAQLLPERYQDSDFRETFSNLIGHEIDRIDSLVNQLLRFARPAKPHLTPKHVHEILEKSLLLVGHRLYQKDIKLTRSFQAKVDTIRGDADQLEQVFLNFFINAMDAMKNGGELTVTTKVGTNEEWVSALTHSNGASRETFRISICDTGEGIRSEDIPHVFDPFFTTKDYGTGLGLSVVHGIVQEHGGQIEVESELRKGTSFHILLPLVRFEREVAVA
jgi:PAS domain S-box-containing protein